MRILVVFSLVLFHPFHRYFYRLSKVSLVPVLFACVLTSFDGLS